MSDNTTNLSKDDIEGLAESIRAYEYGDSREALSRFAQKAMDSLGNPEARKTIAGKCAAMLKEEVSQACRHFLCRQLAILNVEETVASLEGLLEDEALAFHALEAIEKIDGNASILALRKALRKTEGRLQAGVVNALGRRRDVDSSMAMIPLLSGKDAMIATASARALGNMGAAAVKLLLGARGKAASGTRIEIGHALLSCAESLLKEGKQEEARKVYSTLQSDESPVLKKAAAIGLKGIA